MSTMPFDTYSYVKELIHGGFTEQQAEANMRALVKAFEFSIDNKVVTKSEFKDMVSRLEFRLEEMEKKFVTKDEFNSAITRLEKDIKQVEHRLEIKIQHLDHKIDKIFLKTMVSTGSMLTVACSVMTFLIKF